MKKRIVSAALAVLMISAVTSCADVKKAEITPAETTSAVHTTSAITTTANTVTTTEAPTQTTTVTEKITEIITTTMAVTTTKPTTTAPSTTLPLFDESKLDYYKKVEKALLAPLNVISFSFNIINVFLYSSEICSEFVISFIIYYIPNISLKDLGILA